MGYPPRAEEKERGAVAVTGRTTMLENGDVWPKFEDGIAATAEGRGKRIPLLFLPWRRWRADALQTRRSEDGVAFKFLLLSPPSPILRF